MFVVASFSDSKRPKLDEHLVAHNHYSFGRPWASNARRLIEAIRRLLSQVNSDLQIMQQAKVTSATYSGMAVQYVEVSYFWTYSLYIKHRVNTKIGITPC